MSKTAKLHINIEPELKETAEKVLAEMDLNISQAIRIFLKQVVLTREIPFLVKYQVEEITNIKK
jgi:DNA-damage-inducible protein J